MSNSKNIIISIISPHIPANWAHKESKMHLSLSFEKLQKLRHLLRSVVNVVVIAYSFKKNIYSGILLQNSVVINVVFSVVNDW